MLPEPASAGFLPDQQSLDPTRETGTESQPFKERSRTKQETWGRLDRRKTWPERRRERREVKRLRREAQARREGGLLGRPRGNCDDEDVQTADPFKSQPRSHGQSTPTAQEKRRGDEGGKRSRRSREAERWKKRCIKHEDLYPCGDKDISMENLVSPKQRVRHRRR